MSIWDKIIKSISNLENQPTITDKVSRDASRYAFLDIEVALKDRKVHDIGAVKWEINFSFSQQK